MGAKRKTTEKKAGEPAAKEAKVEEKKEEKKAEEEEKAEDTEPKEPEVEKEDPNKEKEEDDKKDTRPAIKEPIGFHSFETTLNVVPVNGGNMLMALSDGGMQFLIAGARANTGIKSGRYYYEVKVIEALTPVEGRTNGKARVPMPRQLLRLGFSTAGSSLILGDGDAGVCFDSEGFFHGDKTRVPAGKRFGRDQALGVLLNLDGKSPNANTVSLFVGGQRVCQPQPLPEKLKGEALFPHVSFRNVTVQVSFGPTPMAALPFKCRMLQEAASDDVKIVKDAKPKDGKYEVLFPVAFPDEGTFDWLDGFMEKHPTYVELSDRKIQDWAVKSGVWKPKGRWGCTDKPEFNFGLQFMDDSSIRRAINSVTAVVPRNYVVMEVKQNLTQADRKNNLKRFRGPHFKRVAHVVMGEPPKEWKAKVHKKILEDKQAKAEAMWKARKIEKERKKAIAARQKEIAAQKAAAEAKRKAEAEARAEAKKKAEEEAKKKAAAEAGEAEKKEGEEEKKEGEGEKKEGEEEKKEEKKEEEEKAEEKTEEKKDEAPAEEEKKEEEKEEEEEEADEPMPQVELSEEEKKLNFKPPTANDLTLQVLNTAFVDFCIPEKDEGFDEVRYEWQKEAESKAYLKKWILEKKVTSRVEDLTPGEGFKKKLEEFQKSLKEWKEKQKEHKASAASKESEKKEPAEGEKKEDEEEIAKMDVDIFSVEDVANVGNGEPLFANFAFEDWALLTLRFELVLLQLSFKEDVNDPERLGVHQDHLGFYYNRYYRKHLSPSHYGKQMMADVVELCKDAVKIGDDKLLALNLKDDLDAEALATFVKVQEENRRKRQQRIDAGDETARLNFKLLQQMENNPHKGGKDGWKGRKGGGKGAPAMQSIQAPMEVGAVNPAGGAAAAPQAVAPPPAPAATPAPVPPPAATAGGPRLVPAPRAQNWKGSGKPEQSWGGKAGGKWGSGAKGGKAGKK